MVKSGEHCFYVPTLLALILLILVPAAQAQSTGKVSGVVTDAATGDPLPGVSVYLEEIPSVGTISDADGRYFILNVRPGTYTLVMSFVGFATLKNENVQVFSGRTTEVDGALQEEVIVGQEVIVSAERPIVIKDRTSTVSFVTQEAIEKLPVLDMGDLVRFQPGVVTNASGGFNFQGGRQRETAYLIDGIPVNDVFAQSGGNTVNLEVQSVQELQVITGTFDAELGGAQSGVVSVTTRDPGQKLEGGVRVLTGGYLAGHEDIFIGGNELNPTDTKDISVTLGGPLLKRWETLGFFFSGRYEDRVGALQGIRMFTPLDGFKIDTYRRWYRDVYQPDDTRLIALDTARTPDGAYILGKDGQPLTFASGDGEVVDMSWSKTLSLHPKIVFRPLPGSKLSYTALYTRERWQNFDNARRYSPDFRQTDHRQSLTHIVSYTQTFGSSKVLNLRGSYKTSEFERYAFESIDDPGIQYIAAADPVTGFSLGATYNGEEREQDQQLILASDFTWQINDWNEIKTGVQYRRNHFVIEDLDRSWVHPDDPDSLFLNLEYPPAQNYAAFDDYFEAVRSRLPILVPELERYAVNDRFDHTPVELAIFAQDKLEVGSRLVLKGGLRFEYYDVGEKHLIDPRTPTDRIGREDNFTDTPPKYYLSPRLGLSFPISDAGAFRVAYGHFVQMPAYLQMLKNPIFSDINVGRLTGREVGNPNLEPERTIKYEMGIQQEITDFLGVDFSLYYKNIRNLLGTEILATLDNVLYTRTVNRDYGIVRGGTLSLVTRPIGFLLNSAFDVSYSDARGSSSNPDDVANVVVVGRSGEEGDFFLERSVIPLDWDQTLTANLSANVGRQGDWSLGFISQLATGQPYTPTFLDPNLDFPDNEFLNAERKPLLFTFDVNAQKLFSAGRFSYGIRLQVNNVFNYLNERFVNSVSGRAGQIVRLPVVQADRDKVNQYVGLFTRAQDDNSPQSYSSPRQILLGVTVNF